jgi:hypothetical protein
MITKTVYACETCGFESEIPAEVQYCEANAEIHELPPVGAVVKLVSDTAARRHLEPVYTVVEHGFWVGDGCLPHKSAFKTEPACGDEDWGQGYEWWTGKWEVVTNLPPIGSRVKLLMSDGEPVDGEYTVLEYLGVPRLGLDGGTQYSFKVDPPVQCWPQPWPWWGGKWEIVSWCGQCEGIGKDPNFPLSTV